MHNLVRCLLAAAVASLSVARVATVDAATGEAWGEAADDGDVFHDFQAETARLHRRLARRRGTAQAAGTYAVVAQVPHDADAFTQGLLFHDGYLYESTGLCVTRLLLLLLLLRPRATAATPATAAPTS